MKTIITIGWNNFLLKHEKDFSLLSLLEGACPVKENAGIWKADDDMEIKVRCIPDSAIDLEDDDYSAKRIEELSKENSEKQSKCWKLERELKELKDKLKELSPTQDEEN